MERAKVVAEVGPINALPIVHMQTQRSHGKMDNMTTGMVTATTNGLELDMLQLHRMKRNMKMMTWCSWRMRTLPLHCWLWLSVTMTRHQQKGWMNLQVQPNSSLWVMAAGTHKGKSKGRGKPSGKGKNNKGKGKHVFRTQLSVEDRVKRLKELKQRSKCLRCGGQGHGSL